MEKSQELKVKIDPQPPSSVTTESSSPINSSQQQSSIPSQDQIRNLLLVMNDREQKLSELATQQQKLILWRVQFIRLERDWNEVKTHFCLINKKQNFILFFQIKLMINTFEAKLASNLTLAISLTDAEKFHRDHEDIKPFVDVRITHSLSSLSPEIFFSYNDYFNRPI
jgi:hypothetical protein